MSNPGVITEQGFAAGAFGFNEVSEEDKKKLDEEKKKEDKESSK